MAKLLLIEDNDNHAYLIERVLQKRESDLEFARVSDGEQALAYLRRQQPYEDVELPQAVLLDLKLPKVGGHEVLEQIKADEELRFVPVIVLTTSDAQADKRRAYANHANSYVVKPLDFAEFSRALLEVGSYWGGINRTV